MAAIVNNFFADLMLYFKWNLFVFEMKRKLKYIKMNRLENKVAIITGAAGGMGAAEAKLFAKEGAKVIITDVQEEKLKAVAAEIKANGGVVEYVVHDVSLEDSWNTVAQKAETAFGKIDILVNNAGVLGNIMAPLEERTVEEFNKVLSINLLGQFIGVKTVVPYMKKEGAGSIINISSVGGIIGGGNGTAYTASKGGSRIYTKGAAVELAKDNIRVNSVHPGYVETPMTTQMKGSDDFKKGSLSSTPMGRGAKLEEIAYGVLFLASDESSYITGSELVIDGGLTAQ
ncbi:SDR family NAD(P)-dependent oxidoreductase [Anaerophaga thermohalophila]|uniref:SDR family NAD(P)-dependent oxidoreductase n=1 Tax=Anaerophaga thermohalophila TaxID=177400 RepID=UPI001C400859|nr:glucose 1-dehydrogenase [Anaerophaga thermohalophila]